MAPIWPPTNTWFLSPTRVCLANGFFICSSIFAGLMVMTNTQTDHATPFVAKGRICMRCGLKLQTRKTAHHRICRITASRSPVLTRGGICVPPTVTILAVPRFPLNTYGRRAFSVAGPMASNSLPDPGSDEQHRLF